VFTIPITPTPMLFFTTADGPPHRVFETATGPENGNRG